MALKREDGILLQSYSCPPSGDRLHLVLAGETLNEDDLAAVPQDLYLLVTWWGDRPEVIYSVSALAVEQVRALRHADVVDRFWREVFHPKIGPGATSSSPEEELAREKLSQR